MMNLLIEVAAPAAKGRASYQKSRDERRGLALSLPPAEMRGNGSLPRRTSVHAYNATRDHRMRGCRRADVVQESPVTTLETERLLLRPIGVDDAEFIIALLGDPDFVRNIGDRGVRTVDDAVDYIRNGPKGLSESFGWKLWVVTIRETATPIGTCALLERAAMNDVEIGYALMPQFRSKGYAREAAAAVARYGREALGLTRLAAVVNADNVASIEVLKSLGMRHEGMIRLAENGPEVMLFRREL